MTLSQHAQTVETRKAPPRNITASVLLVVAGCIVAGIGDFSFDMRGCAWSTFAAYIISAWGCQIWQMRVLCPTLSFRQ